MAFRDDHQLLEADRLLLGQRVAKAMQKENRTSPSTWTKTKIRRRRGEAIARRLQNEGNPFDEDSKNHRRRVNRIRALARIYGLHCFYCGMVFGSVDDPAITFDHVKSKSEGGTDALENQVLSCAPCNEKKGGIHGDSGRSRYLVGLPSRQRDSGWRAS